MPEKKISKFLTPHLDCSSMEPDKTKGAPISVQFEQAAERTAALREEGVVDLKLVEHLRHIFEPKTMAFIGVSPKPKWGYIILHNILIGGTNGFTGKIYPVNPNHVGEKILGKTVVKNLDEIPEPVDMCFITVPKEALLETFDQMGENNVPGAAIITAGFREMSEPSQNS